MVVNGGDIMTKRAIHLGLILIAGGLCLLSFQNFESISLVPPDKPEKKEISVHHYIPLNLKNSPDFRYIGEELIKNTGQHLFQDSFEKYNQRLSHYLFKPQSFSFWKKDESHYSKNMQENIREKRSAITYTLLNERGQSSLNYDGVFDIECRYQIFDHNLNFKLIHPLSEIKTDLVFEHESKRNQSHVSLRWKW